MERRRVVVDMEQIDLLEQRIVKATELIRSLRRERDAAQMKFQETMASLERLQNENKNLDKDRHEVKELTGQVEVLQEERQAIRGKVTRMLEMMAGHGVRCTCFVLGWVADKVPRLVKRIAEAGHEIASHGYGHELIYEMGRDAFRRDIDRARKVLEDLTGHRVRGYRAPSFSITDRSGEGSGSSAAAASK